MGRLDVVVAMVAVTVELESTLASSVNVCVDVMDGLRFVGLLDSSEVVG